MRKLLVGKGGCQQRAVFAFRCKKAETRRQRWRLMCRVTKGGDHGRTGGKVSDNEEDGLELDLLEESFQFYKRRFDSVYGGFGGAPKFPTPAHLKQLLRLPAYSPEVREVVGEKECVYARGMALTTLACMAKGGIKDQ